MQADYTNKREHAVVLGGSMAGLFAARILSDHFSKVTIVEHDPVQDVPETRKGQPQTRHLHGVLVSAQRFISEYLPEVEQNIIDGGALTGDVGERTSWYQFGGYRIQGTTGMQSMALSRPFMEWHVRRGVTALLNVTLIDETVADELVLDDTGSQVIGVKVTHRARDNAAEVLYADLVIDACGRGTPTPKWLEQLGYPLPQKEEVKINVGYATRVYKRDGVYLDEPGMYMIVPTPPKEKFGSFLFPIEDDYWIVTIGEYHGDHTPADEKEFLDKLRQLPTSDIYDILSKSEPMSEIMTYKYPSSRRFHYDKLKRFPDGFLPLGDAVASFNPIYGQGMASAALQARLLNDVLQKPDMRGMWRSFLPKQAKIIDTIWTLAVGEDFRYPETEGKRSAGTNLVNWYVERVHRATHKDITVYKQFLEVIHLLAPPISLMHPRILWRLFRV